MKINCNTQDTLPLQERKRYACTCRICGRQFLSGAANGTLCSAECKKARKHETDLEYRQTEHGQAVRRKNRKSPTTIATRKRYEQTQAFKDSKHRRNKIYMQRPEAQDLEKVRKLNYYYSHFSKKYNLYDPKAYRVTLEDLKNLFTADTCYYCGTKLTDAEKTIDHKMPVSRGGTNDPRNLVISCQPCNSRKSNQTEEEYRSAS